MLLLLVFHFQVEYTQCLAVGFFYLQTEHRHFLELVHYFKNEVFFGLTTDEELVKKIGLVKKILLGDTGLCALNIALGLCGLCSCGGPRSEQSHIAHLELHLL